MLKLFVKEVRLGYMPFVWFFPLLSAMILIPSYPACVGVSYSLLSLFITCNYARENRDLEYTASLPVPRNQTVEAKCLSAAFLQLLQLLAAVPFACVALFVLYPGGNIVGMDANAAFFGFILLDLAVFNMVFLPLYFKSGCRTGIPMIMGVLAYAVCVVSSEILVASVPALKYALDTPGTSPLPRLLVLAAGVIIYFGGLLLSCRIGVKKFERVSL